MYTNKKIKITLAYILLIIQLAGLIVLSRAKRHYLAALVKGRLESANKPGMFLGSILAVTLFVLNKFSN